MAAGKKKNRKNDTSWANDAESRELPSAAQSTEETKLDNQKTTRE